MSLNLHKLMFTVTSPYQLAETQLPVFDWRSSFKSLSDIGVNTLNEKDMLDSLLFGYNFAHNPDLILEPFKTFLSVTNRFK